MRRMLGVGKTADRSMHMASTRGHSCRPFFLWRFAFLLLLLLLLCITTTTSTTTTTAVTSTTTTPFLWEAMGQFTGAIRPLVAHQRCRAFFFLLLFVFVFVCEYPRRRVKGSAVFVVYTDGGRRGGRRRGGGGGRGVQGCGVGRFLPPSAPSTSGAVHRGFLEEPTTTAAIFSLFFFVFPPWVTFSHDGPRRGRGWNQRPLRQYRRRQKKG